MQKTLLIYIAFIIILLAGCSKAITSKMTRFHNLPAPNAETVEVISMDPNLQNSLEFGQYANLVGRHLGKIGYSSPKGPSSHLIARVGYGIQSADGVKLYEGQVTSRGREGLALMMPYLVVALFQDFPGESGTSNRIKVTP